MSCFLSCRAALFPPYLPLCHGATTPHTNNKSSLFLSSPVLRRFSTCNQRFRPPSRRLVAASSSSPPPSSMAEASAAAVPAEPKPFGVLFVCLGNICRSPAAEAVFTDLVTKRGLDSDFRIDSAGTIGYHEGNPADSRMRSAAKRRGIEVTSISRPIRPSDFKEFDLILAMDKQNREDILNAYDRWRFKETLPDDAPKKRLGSSLHFPQTPQMSCFLSCRAALFPPYLPLCHGATTPHTNNKSSLFLSSPVLRRFSTCNQRFRPPSRRLVAASSSSPPPSSMAEASAAAVPAEPKPFGVLFVCLGNIFRSPAAEAVFTDLVTKRGLDSDFRIDSAGTIGYHEGNPADSRMRSAAKRRGIEVTSISRPIRPSDFKEFDLILAMDKQNREDILNAYDRWRFKETLPDDAPKKVELMCSFCKKHSETEVPDPYYGGQKGFEKVLDILEDACETLLDSIQAQNTHISVRS